MNSLLVVLLLIFSGVSFADENAAVDSFNEYVNSPANAAISPADNNINPKPSHARKHKSKEDSDERAPADQSDQADAKSVLQGIPSKWQVCAVDGDCTAAVADCMSWDAVNKKYLKNLSKNLRSCSDAIDPGFQPEAVCAAKRCQTTDKTTDVSWEEWLSEMRKEPSHEDEKNSH